MSTCAAIHTHIQQYRRISPAVVEAVQYTCWFAVQHAPGSAQVSQSPDDVPLPSHASTPCPGCAPTTYGIVCAVPYAVYPTVVLRFSSPTEFYWPRFDSTAELQVWEKRWRNPYPAVLLYSPILGDRHAYSQRACSSAAKKTLKAAPLPYEIPTVPAELMLCRSIPVLGLQTT